MQWFMVLLFYPVSFYSLHLFYIYHCGILPHHFPIHISFSAQPTFPKHHTQHCPVLVCNKSHASFLPSEFLQPSSGLHIAITVYHPCFTNRSAPSFCDIIIIDHVVLKKRCVSNRIPVNLSCFFSVHPLMHDPLSCLEAPRSMPRNECCWKAVVSAWSSGKEATLVAVVAHVSCRPTFHNVSEPACHRVLD